MLARFYIQKYMYWLYAITKNNMSMGEKRVVFPVNTFYMAQYDVYYEKNIYSGLMDYFRAFNDDIKLPLFYELIIYILI